MKDAIHLAYHYVREGSAPGPNIAPDKLKAQVQGLKDQGFVFLTCGEVVARITTGRPLPEKHATLSFDDSLRDQATAAMPILGAEGVPATFFYTTAALKPELPPVIGFQVLINELGVDRIRDEILPEAFKGTPYLDILDPKRYDDTDRKVGEPEPMRRMKWAFNHWPPQSFKREILGEMFNAHLGKGSQERIAREWFMSGEDILAMQDKGMEIASHTVSHPPLDVTGIEEIVREITESNSALEDLLGKRVESFAWTFGGQFRENAVAAVASHSKSAWNFHGVMGSVPVEYHDLYNIPRFNGPDFVPNEK